MMNAQSITIPLTSNMDLSELLEIAQALSEDLRSYLEGDGYEVEVEEEEVIVEYK